MDLYELIGVPRDAGLDDIKRAYRRLARRYHPDINPGDRAAAVRFKIVADAFEILADPERRRRYDQGGRMDLAPAGPPTFGFEGFDFSATSVSGAAASTFGDLFADVIHETVERATEGAVAGADLHASIRVSFADAIRGADLELGVLRRVACGACGGSGLVPVAEATCPECRGEGTIRSARGHMMFAKSCGRCAGAGRVRQAPCARCGGIGAETRADAIPLCVPAGVADGERLRVAGGGHAGLRGGETGDLYVTVEVDPHPVFRREGDDLHLTVPIGIHEAALGARFEIPTFEGPARLRVPPGVQTGQRIRLRERGVPSRRGGPRGDLVAELRVVLPPVLDDRSRELLRAFGEINTDDVRAGLWRDGARP